MATGFGEDTAKSRRQCREYVVQAIEGEMENPFEKVVDQSILGTPDFVDGVRQKLPRERQLEVTSLNKLQLNKQFRQILQQIENLSNSKI